MSVRMRHTRGHTANRRSHHALVAPRLTKCADCGAMHERHRICDKCGKYRGRLVADVASKAKARLERRTAKLRSMGEEVAKNPEKDTEETKKPAKKKVAKKEDK